MINDPLGNLKRLTAEEWEELIRRTGTASNEAVIEALQANSPANRSRATIMAFAAWSQSHLANDPIEVQRRAFAVALRVLKEHLTYDAPAAQ